MLCLRRAASLLVLLLHLMHFTSVLSKLTLRLRLSSGQVSRIEAEDGENISNLRKRLLADSMIPVGSTLVIKKVKYDEDAAEKEEMTLFDLGLANGEIISVLGGSTVVEETVVTRSNSDAPTGTSSSSSSSSRGARSAVNNAAPAAAAAAARKGRASTMSNADIDARRKSLTKIARQKSTGKRYVSVTSTAGNVLKRVALSKKGGVVLLLGRVVREDDSREVKQSSARDRALAKANRKVSLANAAADTDSGDKDKEPGRECIEVHALYELQLPPQIDIGRRGGSSNTCDLTAADDSVREVCALAAKLGMSVVGIGVSTGDANSSSSSSKDKTNGKRTSGMGDGGAVWSPAHVHCALQIRETLGMPLPTLPSDGSSGSKGKGKRQLPLFCVLGIASSSTSSSSSSTSTSKSRIDRATRDANPGLLLEAFELSTQALELYRKGILTKLTLDEGTIGVESITEGGDGSSSRKRRRPAIVDKMNMASDTSTSTSTGGAKTYTELGQQKIMLKSEVLTQSTETRFVDSLMFAVPLPIVAIDANAPSVMKKKESGALKNRATAGGGSGSGSGTGTGTVRRGGRKDESWKPKPFGLVFEHSFPTPAELASSLEQAATASMHLCDVCEQLAGTATTDRYASMFRRLLDPHFLFHLSRLLDEQAMTKLCASLVDPTTIKNQQLPQAVANSFGMLHTSLSARQHGARSKGSGEALHKPRRRISREMRARGQTGDEDDLEEI
jgi:hypothetical protein